MVWLYLPESLDLISELESPSHLREPFVMSRGKPMPLQSLCRKWKKGGFIRLLSGLMLSHSTADLGVEKWISSLPDSLVNPGLRLENSRKQMMKDGFGKILNGSFARFDLNTSSWKMFQVSLTGELVTFSDRWPREGSMLNGVVSKRPKLGQTIKEIGHLFSPIVPKEDVLFPTISVMDSSQDGTMIRKVARESLAKGGWRGISLPLCVNLYPTPLVTDSKNNGGPGSQKRHSPQLNAIVGGKLNPQWVEWLMGWPIGWTDLERAETELFPFKPESPILSSSKEQLKEVV